MSEMERLPVYEHVVQYYETDQMKVVHHSNYIRWFEEARIFVFEKIGLGYKRLEDEGIISPVVEVECHYKTMSRFYDTVLVEVSFVKFTGVSLEIEYNVRDKDSGEVRCTGRSRHCFIDPEGRVMSLKRSYPEYNDILASYVSKEESSS